MFASLHSLKTSQDLGIGNWLLLATYAGIQLNHSVACPGWWFDVWGNNILAILSHYLIIVFILLYYTLYFLMINTLNSLCCKEFTMHSCFGCCADPKYGKSFSSVFEPIERILVPLNFAWRAAKNLSVIYSSSHYSAAYERVSLLQYRCHNAYYNCLQMGTELRVIEKTGYSSINNLLWFIFSRFIWSLYISTSSELLRTVLVLILVGLSN